MVTEKKFTKGEWSIDHFNGKGSCIDVVSELKNLATICQVYSLEETSYKEPHNEELKANAKLIAAAPELLDALEMFCNTFESTVGYQKYEINVFAALNDKYIKAKTAIKKATL